MGDEIFKDHFEAKDYQLFQYRLYQEMAFVRQLFANQQFDNKTRKLGYELELCLIDSSGSPAPCNQQVLEQADNPLFTYELARFNLEINGNAFIINPAVFVDVENDLTGLYRVVNQTASGLNIETGLFGILPSLAIRHLDPDHYMSDMLRYRLLDQRLMELRNRPIHLDICGEDRLQIEKRDVMLEALGTSLQVHYQFPFDEAVDSYHAALWASMAALAVSANSPLVLQKSCWQESRIAIFKQAVDTRTTAEVHDSIIPRVHFAKSYIESWLQLFEDNDYYSAILPETKDTQVEDLHHFNLHNGTIWRWVRPILGKTDGQYHLRLELRVVPSGPTLIDTMANLVFYIGLIEGLKLSADRLTRIPFEVLQQDFYEVARAGLNANVSWCNGEMNGIKKLLQTRILPVAYQGLQRIGIQQPERWLGIIEQRVSSGQTGACWILDHWRKHHDEKALVKAYLHNAKQNIPVHLWPAN